MPRKLIFSFVILFVFFLRGVAAEKKYEGEGAYMKKIVKSDEEWRRYLTPEQFKIARGRRTEADGSQRTERFEVAVASAVALGV